MRVIDLLMSSTGGDDGGGGWLDEMVYRSKTFLRISCVRSNEVCERLTLSKSSWMSVSQESERNPKRKLLNDFSLLVLISFSHVKLRKVSSWTVVYSS